MAGRITARRLIAYALAAAVCAQAEAGEAALTEYEVKAAFLFNFAKFVEWPPDAYAGRSAPLAIGVLGEDPFGETLEKVIEGKEALGRRLTIRRFKALEELGRVQILFIAHSEQRRLAEALEAVKGTPVLTVGEVDGFAERGGIINLTVEESRVRFEINPAAARRARLKVSSKLMGLARRVVSEKESDAGASRRKEEP